MSAIAAGWPAAAVCRETEADAEERRWIDLARAGDDRAFRWLLERYRSRVVRLAAHVTRRPDEAEDIAQEAFVRAFRGLRGFRGGSRFYTWLYRIVVRLCVERSRRRAWRSEAPGSSRLVAVEDPGPCEGTAERVLVESLLWRLNPAMRAALVLRELEGLPYEEIARILAVPVGTIRSRLHAARAQFRALYEAANEEAARV